MLDEELDKVGGGDGLSDKNIVFMPVVVESDIFPVIGINAWKRNDRASQVAADIFVTIFCGYAPDIHKLSTFLSTFFKKRLTFEDLGIY